MISSFRNFAKTKFAGILVFIMIIPFVFWGMGSMFSSGNTNNIAKINKINISTQDFIDHVNQSNIPQKTIRENLDKNIIEELLSTLISSTLLNLEIKDFNILVSENSLIKMIKDNKNFQDEKGNFERIKYEKFLLENNQSAPGFEMRLKKRELQKKLFEYVGAGTTTPTFLAEKLFKEENRKLELEFFNLDGFYKKKESFTEVEIKNFLDENNEELKVEYIDFNYSIINPLNLIGINEFNQTFFDKIDQIEVDISNNIDLKTIASNFNIKTNNVINFRYSETKNEIQKKIFESRNIEFDIIENGDEYILYQINNITTKSPDIKDLELKEEILELMSQKNKFEYNNDILNKIKSKNFDKNEFKKMGENEIESLILNSIKDNKKFEINSIQLLYSLPVNSFTLIADEKQNIYLAYVKGTKDEEIDQNDTDFKQYLSKQNTNNRNTILKTYDLLLNQKYNVVLNQKTIERVKNFFK